MARLPVDYDRLQYDRIEFSSREWDQTPRVSTIREIERLMPDISRLAANEITAAADMNDLRCFMFNLMAAREFDNKEFADLCQFLADFTEFRIEEKRLSDASRGLEESIAHGVCFYCAGLMDRFPELRDIVGSDRNPQVARAWDTNLAQYREIADIIDDMHREDQSNLRNRGNSNAYNDDRRYARDSRDNGSRYGRGRERDSHIDSRGNYNVRSTTDSTPSRDDGRRDYRRDNYRDDHRDSRRDYRQSRYNDREETRSVNPAYDPSDFAPGPSAVREEKAVEPTVESIVREHRLTPEQPQKDEDNYFYGEFGPIKLLVPKGVDEMDMHAHASIYGKTTASGPDMASEIKRVFTASQAVKETNITADNLDKEDIVVEPGVEMFATVSAMCDGISNSSTASMVAHAGENKEGRRKIFHKAAVVSNAFIGHPHLTDFHNSMADRATFSDLLDFLKRAEAAVNTNASSDAAYASDIRAAVSYYDAFFANEISVYCQEVLRLRVGDPNKPLMTSAIEGYHQLNDYLTNSGQDKLRSAVAAMLSGLMVNLSHNWEAASGVKAGIDGDIDSLRPSEDTVLGATFLPVGYIVTHVPFTMKELGYEITESTAIPDNDVTNFMKAALDVSNTDIINDEVNPSPLRVVMTRDRKVFRVYRYPGNGRAMILVPMSVN